MFQSFFFGGFEGTTGYNMHGEWIDQVHATQHDVFAREDYALLRSVDIRAARESVRWPLVDRDGHFDFSTLQPFVDASREYGIDVIYDLFHFGYPAHIDLFGDGFAARFAEYCYAVTRYLSAQTEGLCGFTPINEPSYFAWAAGEVGLFAPHQRGRGAELKVALARAAIAGIDAIRSACHHAQIINVDALCRVVHPRCRPDLETAAIHFNDHIVFESWDMLAGRLRPELGGSAAHLGTVGINYYWTNQWELPRAETPLAASDARRWALHELVAWVWKRYGVDLLITETSHVDDMRGPWLLELAHDAETLISAGIPLRGVCLYPVLGMPEWHDRNRWTCMGLWDLVPQSPTLGRIPYGPVLDALRAAQRLERLSARDPDNITTEYRIPA